MKLDQFNDLCQRLWGENGVFSDVIALHLTGESQAELSADAATSGPVEINGGPFETGTRVGVRCDEITNPVTRSVVKVTGGADEDAVTMQTGINFSTGEPVTRTVALAAA